MLKKSAGRTEFVLGCWRYCAANSAMGTPTALLTAQTQLERLYLHQLQCSAVQSLNETLTPRILTGLVLELPKSLAVTRKKISLSTIKITTIVLQR
jgi:hypothetical protein